ncbi:hypothetical protein DFH09DRAFT_1069681 [Mycena vulgaris]|nr:hypothetical protein DFH09DRAFT_1069681 [Mycena vulgaris]
MPSQNLAGDSDLGSTPPADDGTLAKEKNKAPRRVVDVQLDDENDEWEDEKSQLQGLGTTTHRSRNPAKGVITIRKRRHIATGVNARATTRKRRGETAGRMQRLAEDLAALDAECEERAHELSDKHGMKLKEICRRMLSSSGFKTKCKVSLYNAKISAIMGKLNEGKYRSVGERLKITDIKRMVAADPSILEDFSAEEEEEMVAELEEKRKCRYRGTCTNNLAVGADVKCTVECLMVEITDLAERAGMMGFAMFMRGHIHDTTIPVTIQSWGALDFFREVLKKDPADVSALFELWAVSRERGATGGDTLLSMQKECTEMIKSGLQPMAGRTKIAMSYKNYIKALVEGKNLGLVGWPEGVEFKRMSKKSVIGPLRILRDALKCGTCKWKVLTSGEKARLVAQFKDMVNSGEAAEKVCAPHAGASGKERAETRKSSRVGKRKPSREVDEDELSGEEEPEATETVRAPRARASGKGRTETRKSTGGRKKKPSREVDEDEPNGEEGPVLAEVPRLRKAISEMSVDEKQRRLLALVKTKKTSGKRKATDAADDEGRGRKLRRQGGTGGSKRKRDVAEDDEEGEARVPAKKTKNSSATSQGQKTKSTSNGASSSSVAPTVLRPRPKPKPKRHATPPLRDSPARTCDPQDSAPSRNSPASTPSRTSPSRSPPARNVVRGRRGGPPGVR